MASVRDHRLSARDSVALRDPASDELRRLLLAMPVDLDPGTEETACVRRAAQRRLHPLTSRLADTLGLDHHVLRRRVADLSQEVREFAGVAQALAREALDAPAVLERGAALHAPVNASSRTAGVGRSGAMARLTPGERRIAALLAEGRSNREIADALVVSPETVKSHVGKILRKLGVANRVEAASLLLRDA